MHVYMNVTCKALNYYRWFVVPVSAMRTSEFDSSSEEEEVGEEQLTPLHISW